MKSILNKKRTQTSLMREVIDEAGRCELCGSKRDLQAHHIIPFCFYPVDDKENLICVCKGCHAKLTPSSVLTKIGIETARLNGKQIGQPKGAKLTTKKSIRAKEIIRKHSQDFEGTLSDVDVMKLIGCARGSYYKYKKELRNG